MILFLSRSSAASHPLGSQQTKSNQDAYHKVLVGSFTWFNPI